MKTLNLILISLTSALLGIIFLAYQQEWIIIRSPFAQSTAYSTPGVSKQSIQFSFWQGHAFKQETRELIAADDIPKKSAQLISNWLTLLHDEKIVKHKITLQTSVFDPSATHLYVSFDRTPFEKQQSTHEKLMFIEGLKRTLRENGIKLQGIYFLVNHAVMQDEHLDFSNAWQ